MKVAIIGGGYVGLVTAAVLAELDHEIECVEKNPQRLEILQSRGVPIYEPGLAQLMRRSVSAGRLVFTGNSELAVGRSEVVFLAVGTPPKNDGSTDLSYIDAAAQEVALGLRDHTVVVIKSTVPVGTGDRVEAILTAHAPAGATFAVVSNPEFLREGSAIADSQKPDRIVIGTDDRAAALTIMELYIGLSAPMVVTDRRSSELIKYAANAFLATRISFANTIAGLCDQVGANVELVMEGAGMDRRVGPAFFKAGLGYGGSCFPKDVASLVAEGQRVGAPMNVLESVMAINERMPVDFLERADEAMGGIAGTRVAVLGLAFKAGTDDMRESRAVVLIRRLRELGCEVRVWDPVAMPNARTDLKGIEVHYSRSPREAVVDADAVVLVTEWPELRELKLSDMAHLMSGDWILDGRNFFDPAAVASAGLNYMGVGRGHLNPMEGAA